MLTLESFEEASEIVKKVTQETKLIKQQLFLQNSPETKYI